MGLGPIYAAPKVLEYTGLTMDDMDVIELNEAFAAQVSPCIKELGMDPARVNPNGGAMALRHPLGATGAVLSCAISRPHRRQVCYGYHVYRRRHGRVADLKAAEYPRGRETKRQRKRLWECTEGGASPGADCAEL